MGFFDDAWSAATAPITTTVSATKQVLSGNIGGALKTSLSGLGAGLKPVGTYSREYFINAPINFATGAYRTVGGLASGNLGQAGSGLAQVGTSGTNIAVAENTTGTNYTGYSPVSRGTATPSDYRKAAATTAAIATMGGLGTYAAPALAASQGNYAGAISGAAGLAGGIDLGGTTPEGLKDAYNTASPYLPQFNLGGATSSLTPVAVPGSALPAASSGGALPVLILAGAVGAWYFLRRRV
jgi:hypothetical protein